jgi:c-di-GMP-binding flagellar brake protein YcgR
MSDERRKQGRVSAVIDVVWEGATAKYEARTSDLNSEGCFIDSIGHVSVGEIITFKLRLPAEDWIELQAEVVYAFPNTGFGVRFKNVSEAARKRLEWLVKAEAYRAEKRGDET